MTTPWPSDRPRTGRASKAPKGKAYPMEWTSAWLVALLIVAVLAGLTAALWPVASVALDTIQQLSDTLNRTVRNALI